jgi:hypothetical protein
MSVFCTVYAYFCTVSNFGEFCFSCKLRLKLQRYGLKLNLLQTRLWIYHNNNCRKKSLIFFEHNIGLQKLRNWSDLSVIRTTYERSIKD